MDERKAGPETGWRGFYVFYYACMDMMGGMTLLLLWDRRKGNFNCNIMIEYILFCSSRWRCVREDLISIVWWRLL